MCAIWEIAFNFDFYNSMTRLKFSNKYFRELNFITIISVYCFTIIICRYRYILAKNIELMIDYRLHKPRMVVHWPLSLRLTCSKFFKNFCWVRRYEIFVLFIWYYISTHRLDWFDLFFLTINCLKKYFWKSLTYQWKRYTIPGVFSESRIFCSTYTQVI